MARIIIRLNNYGIALNNALTMIFQIIILFIILLTFKVSFLLITLNGLKARKALNDFNDFNAVFPVPIIISKSDAFKAIEKINKKCN